MPLEKMQYEDAGCYHSILAATCNIARERTDLILTLSMYSELLSAMVLSNICVYLWYCYGGIDREITFLTCQQIFEAVFPKLCFELRILPLHLPLSNRQNIAPTPFLHIAYLYVLFWIEESSAWNVSHALNTATMNAPDRFELFLLGEGEKKVTETTDTRIPSSSLFTFNKEDHTLGNLLRARLLSYPHVLFAAYRVPHPLFPTFELRVQTNGEITPRNALVQACRDLVSDLGVLSREFTKEWELRKMAGDEEIENR